MGGPVFAGEVCGDSRGDPDHQFRIFPRRFAAFLNVSGFIRGIAPELRERLIDGLGQKVWTPLQNLPKGELLIPGQIARNALQRSHTMEIAPR